MALINEHFLKLQNNYLFSDIAKKVNSFKVTHPKDKIIRMGIGDVTQPLAPAVIEAMHKAVEEMASKDTFHGYGTIMPAGESLSNRARYSSATEQKAIVEI